MVSSHLNPEKGTLYIVSTPIGNMEDITLRALRILKEVDLIAAEDTRRTGLLLKHFGIQAPLTSYFEGNELKKREFILAKLKEGKNVALVSDAGTPGVSDPGFRLIQLAIENQLPIVPIPGSSAVITALSVSGLPTDAFLFKGFLPHKSKKRRDLLKRTGRGAGNAHLLRISPSDLRDFKRYPRNPRRQGNRSYPGVNKGL